jgi:hypothetical protein
MRIDHDDDGADWMMTSQSLLPAQYAQAAVVDDEHKLIARYSAKLAGRTTVSVRVIQGVCPRNICSIIKKSTQSLL